MIAHFGEYVLDLAARELRGPQGHTELEPKCFDLLQFLVKNRDRAIHKDEIFETIWPGVFVTDASLSTAIRQIRSALGDDGTSQQFIRTIRGYGFRFVADVMIESGSAGGIGESASTKLISTSGKPTIAVRPFQLIGGNTADLAIAEAIPSELIATLSRLRWLNVIARGSSFSFSVHSEDNENMSARLDARFIVSGMVEWMGAKVALTAELTDAHADTVIWSNRLVGALTDVFSLRSQIALELVSALEIRLPAYEADRLSNQRLENIDAWGQYHLGVRHIHFYNREHNQVAADHFKKALDLDPKLARAYCGLSYTEFQIAFQHYVEDTNHHKALSLRYAEQAMDLDELDPYCNLTYGRAKWLSGDAEGAIIWIERSTELNPNYAFGYYNYAMLNTVLCNGHMADETSKRSLLLSPLDPHLQSMYGIRSLASFIVGDLTAAQRYADLALNAANPHLYVYIIAAAAYSKGGEMAKAQDCVARMRNSNISFGKKEFLAHYNLRDKETYDSLSKALSSLQI